jgi:hypothetical protein
MNPDTNGHIEEQVDLKTNNMIEFIKKHYSKLGMGLALSMLVINYFQQRELSKLRAQQKVEVVVGGDIQKAQTIDSLMNVIDSIRAENLPLQVQLGRYDVTLELLREEDKKAAEKFELILTTQTE